MTEEERRALADRRNKVLKRMRQTGRGETVCLADWEVKIILDLIDGQWQKIKSLSKVLMG